MVQNILNQESDLKRFLKLWKNLMRKNKEEMEGNHVPEHYLNGLKINIVRSKKKKYNVALLD